MPFRSSGSSPSRPYPLNKAISSFTLWGLLCAALVLGWVAPLPARAQDHASSRPASAHSTSASASTSAASPMASAAPPREPKPTYRWSGKGCTQSSCHGGIEPIREPDSGMMKEIFARGKQFNSADGCVVCHGGNPMANTKEAAHKGSNTALKAAGGPDEFFPNPGSPWVNGRSCGQCHAEWVKAQWNSLMMTEAGKIQGTAWSFGSLEGYDHKWGNYDAKNPKDPHARLGTKAYRAYMAVKSKAFPTVFVKKQTTLPKALKEDELDKLKDHPELAVYSYLRAECERCHLGVKGRQRRGDFRGMGCGGCHIPYGNEGLYEGGDASIDPKKPGHMLVHRIQATRDAKVKVNKITYSGIPVETCTTCHNRGKRIGVSYQGLMESAYGSPYTEGGGGQIGLHTKHYIAMEKDVHYKAGMLCQDCHSSNDVHGDGFLTGTNLGAVEIECSDCHGTPNAYPWELPLGWGDENKPGARKGPGRGVGKEVPAYLSKGKVWPAKDGYVLTARGNPLPEVIREGNQIVVHTAGGKDLKLDPLKAKLEKGTLSREAQVAMVNVGKHMDTMECYACHSSWAPQCYGCHIKADFSGKKRSFDWVAAGHEHLSPDHRADDGEGGYKTTLPGKMTETRSFLRWEDPALGVNGEGRVTPLIPGCQVSVTVIDKDGKEIVRNRIFRTTPGTEGSGKEGQLGSDMSPVHPHTVGKSRSCESCHSSEKALGYGIGGGKLNPPWNRATTVDLTTADGKIIPKSARVQIEPVKGLEHDWSAVVTRLGKQTQTVGHHFPGSGPLSAEQRKNMERRNVCIGCHAEIPNRSLAVSALHHIAEMSGQLPKNSSAHDALVHKIALSSAWGQILAALAGLSVAGVGLVWVWRDHQRRKGEGSESSSDGPGGADGEEEAPSSAADPDEDEKGGG